MLMIALYVALTLVVSYFNARAAGQAWVEANALGGWGRLLIWCAAIQAAIGFTMVAMLGEVGIAYLALPKAAPMIASHIMAIGYLFLIVPAVGTGLVLTLHSWIEAYKKRDLSSIGAAAYNTIVQFHNMSGMREGLGLGWSSLRETFDGDDGWKILGVIIPLAVAFGSGILITYALINRYRGSIGFLASFETK